MSGDPEGSGELVQVPIGQLAVEDAVKLRQGVGREKIGRGGQSLADLEIRFPVQIGSLDVAERVRLTRQQTNRKREKKNKQSH